MANMEKEPVVYPTVDGLLRERLMTRFKRATISAFLASVIVQAVAAHAATYYVATTGIDSNSCAQATNLDTPKLTIPAGVKCLSGGDTLIVKAGTYVNQEITNPPAGRAGAYTVIKGDPGGPRPVLLPNRAAFQRGFYCGTGSACHHIELRYFEIRDGHESVKLHGTDADGYPHHVSMIGNYFFGGKLLIASSHTGYIGGDHLIQGNEFNKIGHLAPGYRPGVNAIYNTGNRTIVEQNTFHNIAHGVGIWRTPNYLIRGVIIRNNVFYDVGREDTADTWQQGQNGSSAIHVSTGGGDHQIYNNVIYRSGDRSTFSAIVIKTYYGAEETPPIQVYNNTIFDIKHASAPAIFIRPNSGGPHVIKNNIAYLAGAGIVGGTQSNNLTDDPSFKDPARADFTLQRRSAAIDTGGVIDIVTTDFRGVRRPQGAGYDIGAYEAGTGSHPLPPQDLSVH